MASKRKTTKPGAVRIKDPKLCVECRWFKESERNHGHICMHRLAQYVSGTWRYTTEDMRRDADGKALAYSGGRTDFLITVYAGDGQCGPHARLWEAKPPEPAPEPPAFQAHEPIEPGSVVRLEGVTGWKVPRRNWWRWW